MSETARWRRKPAQAERAPEHPPERPRLLDRLFGRFTKTDHELESHDLRQDSLRKGGTHIRDLRDREKVTVVGTVRSVTLRPRVDVPALVAELYDGSDSVNLVWIGRRQLHGVNAGTALQASGRICFQNGVATIFNPSYELLP